MSQKDLLLYSYHRCPFAMRVRLVLHEKGIPFTILEEDLKNKSEELKRLHPEARVPLLVHGKNTVYESSVVTEYLEEAFPKRISLMPIDAAERAEVRLWTYWCNHVFKPDVDRYKYGTSRATAKECAGVENRLMIHMKKMEDRLKGHPWLVGENYSLADIHLFPFFRQLHRIKPEPVFLNEFVKVLEWGKRIEERPAFIETMRMP